MRHAAQPGMWFVQKQIHKYYCNSLKTQIQIGHTALPGIWFAQIQIHKYKWDILPSLGCGLQSCFYSALSEMFNHHRQWLMCMLQI